MVRYSTIQCRRFCSVWRHFALSVRKRWEYQISRGPFLEFTSTNLICYNTMIYKIYVVALERKLSQRGPREELVSRGIMPGLCAIYCHQKFKSYLQCFNISVSFLIFQRSVLLRQLFLRERSWKEPR